MSISYPVAIPSSALLSFKTFSLTLDYAQASSESPFTLKEQIYDYVASRWMLNITYPPLSIEQAKAIRGFILSLNGRVGTFTCGDPLNASMLGSPGGSPLVKGAGQTGYELIVDGLGASLPRVFAAGDDFTLQGSLYTVVKDVASNGSGEATLDIQPCLRGTIADNAALTTSNATGIFRLDNAKMGWSAGTDKVYDISISAVEAL